MRYSYIRYLYVSHIFYILYLISVFSSFFASLRLFLYIVSASPFCLSAATFRYVCMTCYCMSAIYE